jgi:hypothetical protein
MGSRQTELQRTNVYGLPQQLKELFAFHTLVPTTILASLWYLISFLRPGRRTFDPTSSIPDLSGKVIAVTGGNAGIGKRTVLQLAKHNPDRIYLASRTISKAEAAVKEIKAAVPNAQITILPLDLMNFNSIRAAAKQVMAGSSRLDVVILNAGK